MNSDDIIEKLISKGIEYDKSEITVESILEDLINPESDISNMMDPIKGKRRESTKLREREDIEKILKEEKYNFNNELENILNEDDTKLLSYDINNKESEDQKEKEDQNNIKLLEEMELMKKKKKEEEEKKEKKRNEVEKKRKIEEEIKQKKIEEERKKLDSFIPQFPNPVDFVQYIEIVQVNTKISGEMQNFFLQNIRKRDEIYNLSILNSFPEINKKISDYDINYIYAKRDFLIICKNKGEIFIFSMKNQKNIYKVIPKNLENKEITCLDISDDLFDILCGYQDGTIALINIRNSEIKFSTNKIHKDASCLEIKIYKKEKDDIYFVSSGVDGQVFYSSFKKLIFWRLSSSLVINNYIPFFMIKFINISPKNQYYYPELSSLNKYVLLGSLGEIKLFCIEPKIEQILEIRKPDNFTLGNIAPDSQIGIGRVPEIVMRFAKKDEKNHLILIISWGKIIYFYQLSLSKGEITNEFKEIGYYINIFDILRIGFLNSSVVFCLDKSYGIKLLNTSKINQGEIKFTDGNPVIPEKNYLAEIEKSRHICESIENAKNIAYIKNNKIDTFLYSIIDNDCSIQVLGGEKQIYKYNLVSWDSYLKELQKNNEFLKLFSIGIDIYNGKMAFFSNMPEIHFLKRKVGDFLKEIIPQYVNVILKEKKSEIESSKENDEKIYECINIVIEVCIELEAVEFLLRTIEPLFEEKEYGEFFLARLEPFILCDKISKYILSVDIIINLIELYNQKGKLEILGQMLLHINILALDKPEIKQKLEETNLIIPLIYLYHNGKNEDYFAPLQKMFDYFNSKKDYNKVLFNEEDNIINYGDVITKKLISLKDVRNSKEYNGHRILWYIKWCLTGKKFPDNSINMKDNLFDELVSKIAFWLLNDKIMDGLLTFDPKNYFITYKNLLSIKFLYSRLVLSFNDENKKNKILNELKEQGIEINDLEPITLVDYIVNWCKRKNENKIFFYLYDFIIEISRNNDINIKKELRIESICYILKHYKQTIKKINNQEVESLIKIIIEFLKDEMFNKEDYKNILLSINDNMFDEIKLFLLEQTENYKECIEIYLSKNKNSNINNENDHIFIWIKNIINNMDKKSKQYEELLEVIKDNIFSLISISIKDFYYLSREIFKNNKNEIIKILEKNKKIQLEYIELIIHSLIKKDHDFIEDTEDIKKILILHINLLCQLKQFDRILPYFKSCSLYPFEECLNICKNAKAHDACIYLYLKEGSILEAFNLSLSNLEDIFNNIVENINKGNNNEENKKSLDKLNKYLLNVRNICEINKKTNIEDLWFRLLDALYKFENESIKLLKKYENDNIKKKNSEELYNNIFENIKDLTEKMCLYVSIKKIIEFVTNKNKISEFKDYKELIMKLLKIYSNSTDILFSVKSLFTSLILKRESTFQEFNIKGDLLNEKCDKCNKKFKSEEILRFNCKHFFHKKCIITEFGKEPICPICPDIEGENINIGEKSLVLTRPNNINEKNKGEKTFSKKITQKLENYDNKSSEKNKLMISKYYPY